MEIADESIYLAGNNSTHFNQRVVIKNFFNGLGKVKMHVKLEKSDIVITLSSEASFLTAKNDLQQCLLDLGFMSLQQN